MSIQVTGTIARPGIGPGTWAVVTPTGETYELKDAPPALKQVGLQVQIQGELCPEVMTLAMIGPVLAVQSFTIAP
ncbi:hypothetical protein [Trichothermofontia sp.]